MTREEAMYLLNNLRSVAEGEEDEAIDMAIEALNSVTDSENDTVESKNDVIKNLDDTISRQDAIAVVGKYKEEHGYAYYDCACDIENDLKQLPSASVEVGEWIPVTWHEITEEEREREGYPKDWVVHIDCEMPCDGDEILVQTKSGYIRWDVCYTDCEVYLDSGWDWIDDIVAWMPLPKPYEGGYE